MLPPSYIETSRHVKDPGNSLGLKYVRLLIIIIREKEMSLRVFGRFERLYISPLTLAAPGGGEALERPADSQGLRSAAVN